MNFACASKIVPANKGETADLAYMNIDVGLFATKLIHLLKSF